MRTAVIFAIWVLWLMGAAGLIDFHVCIGAPGTCAMKAQR